MIHDSRNEAASVAPGGVLIALLLGAVLACGGSRPASVEHDPAPPALPPPANDTRFERAVAYSAERSGRVLHIVEGSLAVLEVGQNGHDPTLAYPLYTASESFWGPLALAASVDGLLDLDERVAEVLPEFTDTAWKRQMDIRQLLDYTSGLSAGVSSLQLGRGNAMLRALSMPMVSRPGERFQYGPSHLLVFGAVLERALEPQGENPLGYLERRIFAPIGLELEGWDSGADGTPTLPTGARIRASEWAKFGRLLRDGGAFGGAA